MRDNNGTLEGHLFSHTKRTDRLTEAHLRIPEHLIPLFKALKCTLYSVMLLWAEEEWSLTFCNLFGTKTRPPSLNSLNSIYRSLEITTEPLSSAIKIFSLDTRAIQDAMHLIISEAILVPILDAECQLGVEELVADPRCLGVLSNTSTGSLIESIAIGLGRGRSDIIRQRSLPDLKAVFMRLISDSKDVDQSGT